VTPGSSNPIPKSSTAIRTPRSLSPSTSGARARRLASACSR
jgi:hypothetical protein